MDIKELLLEEPNLNAVRLRNSIKKALKSGRKSANIFGIIPEMAARALCKEGYDIFMYEGKGLPSTTTAVLSEYGKGKLTVMDDGKFPAIYSVD